MAAAERARMHAGASATELGSYEPRGCRAGGERAACILTASAARQTPSPPPAAGGAGARRAGARSASPSSHAGAAHTHARGHAGMHARLMMWQQSFKECMQHTGCLCQYDTDTQARTCAEPHMARKTSARPHAAIGSVRHGTLPPSTTAAAQPNARPQVHTPAMQPLAAMHGTCLGRVWLWSLAEGGPPLCGGGRRTTGADQAPFGFCTACHMSAWRKGPCMIDTQVALR